MTFKTFRRKLVVLKFMFNRGYMWCQLPTLALMGAGVLTPYIQQYFPSARMWQISLFALIVFMFVGFMDKRLGVLGEEASYTTEVNPMLMKGLKGELKNENKI